jgi:hypothetical protein
LATRIYAATIRPLRIDVALEQSANTFTNFRKIHGKLVADHYLTCRSKDYVDNVVQARRRERRHGRGKALPGVEVPPIIHDNL